MSKSSQYSGKLEGAQGSPFVYHSYMDGKPFDPSQGKLVLLIGPSGVGKSAILKRLRVARPDFQYPKSATTRAQRPNESTDLYHFVSNEEFDRLLGEHKFLEWAIVHGGERYGTMVDEIIPFIEQGKTVVREVDVQGFVSIRNNPLFDGESAHRLQSIFILPESKEQLIDHIQKRAPMNDDELQRRLQSMEKEMQYADHCTVTVKNPEGKLDETVQEVARLIMGS